MVNPYKFRKLFKPIKEATSDAYKAAVENPYVQNYADVVGGKRGRIAQGFGLAAPVYASNKIMDMAVPQRTVEPEREVELNEDITVEETPKEDNILIEENEIQIDPGDAGAADESTNISEGADSSNSDTTTSALVDQSNNYMDSYDNDSLARIEGYKDVIRQFMGDGDEGMRMQKMGLMLQLGSALMSGKSMDSGMKGFMDIIGQAGMQVAPTLFQMGVEKGKAEREIGAAALNMYMTELDSQSDRSGPIMAVYENVYKTGENNQLLYGNDGNPIVLEKRKVGDYYRKSPKMDQFMAANEAYGVPRYTFLDPNSSEGAGQAAGLFGNTSATAEGTAARDAQMSYARFIGQGLDTMADVIMPILIQN